MKKDIQHQIISDLKKVAKSLNTKTIKRDEYADHGKFSEHAVKKYFGTFTHAMKAAGLETLKKAKKNPWETKHEKEKLVYKKREELEFRFNSEILPYMGKYSKSHSGLVTIVAGSDFHALWMDPFCVSVFIDACKRIQPSIISLVGDIFDFYDISRFNRDPTRESEMQSEINFVIEKLLKPLRKACPNSEIDFFLGNHEWRLFAYMSSQAPGLASLDCLQFNNLFKLDDLKINLVAQQSFLTAKKKKDRDNYKIYEGLYVLSHGTSLAKHCAAQELDRYNLSGASGHVHRHQNYSKGDLSGKKEWTTLGCMCLLESGKEYIPDVVTWAQGFEIAHIDKKRRAVVKEYIHFNEGLAIVGGKYYTRK